MIPRMVYGPAHAAASLDQQDSPCSYSTPTAISWLHCVAGFLFIDHIPSSRSITRSLSHILYSSMVPFGSPFCSLPIDLSAFSLGGILESIQCAPSWHRDKLLTRTWLLLHSSPYRKMVQNNSTGNSYIQGCCGAGMLRYINEAVTSSDLRWCHSLPLIAKHECCGTRERVALHWNRCICDLHTTKPRSPSRQVSLNFFESIEMACGCM